MCMKKYENDELKVLQSVQKNYEKSVKYNNKRFKRFLLLGYICYTFSTYSRNTYYSLEFE